MNRYLLVLALSSFVLNGCSKEGGQEAAKRISSAAKEVKSNDAVTERTGKFVIDPRFEEAAAFHDGLAAVRVGDEKTGKYGYVDKQGKMVIDARFDDAKSFGEGLAAVRVGDEKSGKWGYVDTSGKFRINPVFSRADSFQEGLALVGFKAGSYKLLKAFIDKEGSVKLFAFNDPRLSHAERMIKMGEAIDVTGNLAPYELDVLSDFREGRALVENRNTLKRGYIDRKGAMVGRVEFDELGWYYYEGFAAVRIGEKWGYLDRDGRVVISPMFEEAHPFGEGLAPVVVNDQGVRKWAFIDKGGKVAFNTRFDYVGGLFSDGLAPVRVGDEKTGKYGYVDKQGKMVIDARFDDAKSFGEGLAPVRVGDLKTGKYGFVDKQGRMVINPQFDRAEGFKEGFAAVRVGDEKTGKWGYISRR